jgi:drug/metabolite transporter (DMT)-like permease
MKTNLGIIFAFIAMFCWSFGDFYIQKAVRKSSVIRSLFYITFSGAIVLIPFIWKELSVTLSNAHQNELLLLASFMMLLAAIFNFMAMRDGKIAIIEPILSLELPIVVILGVTLHNDIKKYPKVIAAECFFDNIAWIAFAYATTIDSNIDCYNDYGKLYRWHSYFRTGNQS